MSFTRKVAYNTFIQILGKGLGTVLGLVTLSLMTHYLSAEGFGYYSTIITYLTLFGVMIEFGFQITTLQLFSEKRYDIERLIGNILSLRVLSAFVAFSLAPILIWFFPYPDEIKWGVVVTLGSFVCITLNQIFIAVLQIHLRMDWASVAEVVGRAVLLGTTALGIYYDCGFLYIMFAIVLGSVINLFINVYAAKRFVRFRFIVDFVIWKDIFSRSWPVGLSIFFNLLYLKADILILSLLRTQSEVGIYGAAYRFLDVLTTIPAMFMGLVLPILRMAWVSNDMEKFKRVFQKSFDFMIILVVPVIVGTIATADKIIHVIAPNEFFPAILVLRILAVALGAIFIGGGLYGYTIISLNKQRSMMFGYGITAIISLILYFIFIPRYSYYGAAGVTIFSEYLISFLIFIVVTRTVKFLPKIGILIKAIVASFIMYYVIHLFPNLHLFFIILLAMFVYGSSLILLRGVTKETLREVFMVS